MQLEQIRVNHLLEKLRENAGFSQAELAKKVKWSQAVVSRVENGERRLSPEELSLLLEAIGTQEAAKLSVRLAHQWTVIPQPQLDHPNYEALWEAEEVAKEVDLLTKQEGITAAFHNRLSEYENELLKRASDLTKTQHTIAFIGSIGVGKSTAICRALGLELPPEDGKNQPILEAGAGGVTICEVHIQTGPQYGIIVEPCSDEDVRQFTQDFAEHILRSKPGTKKDDQDGDAEGQAISKEIDRAIRNMSGLRTRKERIDGKLTFTDDAKKLAEHHSAPKDLVIEILSRMQLHKRSERHIWYEPSKGNNPFSWIKDTFELINNGRHPDFNLPCRIDVIIPEEPFATDGLQVEVVDTKGIDRTAARADLEQHLNDVHTTAVLCSPFNNAPSAECVLLLERAKDAGVRDIETKAILLALPRHEEALAVKDDSGQSAETVEEGYELKSEQIRTSLEALNLQDLPVSFFNAREDSSPLMQQFLVDNIMSTRSRMRTDLGQTCTSIRDIIANQEREQTQAVIHSAANTLRNWLKNHRDLPESRLRVESTLLRVLQEAHASTIHATIRRYGQWPSLSFSHQLGHGSRVLTANLVGLRVKDFTAICDNILTDAEYSDAHSLVEQSLRVLRNSYDAALQKMQLLGETRFESCLKEDVAFWNECENEWGTGSGYRRTISLTTRAWFADEERARINTSIVDNLREMWQDSVARVEAMLEQ